MYRFLYFLAIVIIPIIFGWWLFVPMGLFLVYLAKLPYEIVLAGFFLDTIYYFGDGSLTKYPLTVFSVLLILIAFFLSKRIHWSKII
jgi:hypothetical protein